MQNSNVTMSQCLISGQRSTLLESQLHWKRGCCSQLLHRTQAVTRVSLRRRSTLQGWWASIYVSMPICVSEGINCCNCYGWSARTFYYNVYALVPAAVKGCCPRAPAVSLLLLLSLRRSPGPTLSPVCKDASPMSTVIAGPYWFCHCHQRWNLYLGELWLSYCQCDSFPKHLTWLLRYAVTKWKPLIRTRGWIQLRPRVWIQIRVLCRCGVIAPCLLLLLLVVEGIFKWNPGKCAKSHHAILYTVTIPSRL